MACELRNPTCDSNPAWDCHIMILSRARSRVCCWLRIARDEKRSTDLSHACTRPYLHGEIGRGRSVKHERIRITFDHIAIERIRITFVHIAIPIHNHDRRHTRGLARFLTGHIPWEGKLLQTISSPLYFSVQTSSCACIPYLSPEVVYVT